ncbi:MAG TPA: pyridoxal-phosphate dependent enzyme, partial [Anaeromyxobacter sp.]|nr:pyridoxal-phosphate dependent enzyme [Anaeromyxobacter sp.]
YGHFTMGDLKVEGTSITEGIGQGRVTRNVEDLAVDRAYRIPDAETVQTVFDLVRDEGLVLGSSSGTNVAGAVRLARELGRGHVVVTVLCDSGTRYASRLFNPAFLRSKQLPVPAWLETAPAALPDGVMLPSGR